jgi:hypothetical protein
MKWNLRKDADFGNSDNWTCENPSLHGWRRQLVRLVAWIIGRRLIVDPNRAGPPACGDTVLIADTPSAQG